ncbi:hypothetical protein E1B28_011051 [Marasmius oreades]|uniref:F-box domain-containing protein n=1 Tax=Marasmius oreades TaxID=181124 RepID=A0A9P7RUC1_9AGAR|nr:uncharacterized protein E1B28_011051 [Marasmius oreades]KAG7089361.1 hypothetical protein E1B28_011051 [Marasmius oreades]
MDIIASLSLAGIDPFLSEDDASIVRQMLDQDEKLMASIDEEIARVKATLQNLTKKRNAALQRVTLYSGPSEADVETIRASISEGQIRLQSLKEDIREARLHLDSLLDQEQHSILDERSSSNDTNSSITSSDHLHTLHDSIGQHRNLIKDLETEQDDILDRIAHYNAILSPIRLLPAEIISEIFFHCLPDQLFIRPSPCEAPLLLTQVCRNWRETAFSTPRLWSSIAVTVHKTRSHPHPSLIENWIMRSKAQPLAFELDVRLRLEDTAENKSLITGAIIMAKFRRVYNRWKCVRLTHADWRIDEMGLREICVDSGPPPLLETLHMSRDYWLGDVQKPLRMLLAAPRLSSVHWRGIIAEFRSPAEIIPIEKLSEVKIDNHLTKEQFHSLLSMGSNLVRCDLTVYFARNEELFLRCALPRLRQLVIATNRGGNLFDSINTPALHDLTIRRMDGPPSVFQRDGERFWSQESFLTFMGRSGCSLNSLDLGETDITPTELLEILQLLSDSLQSLAISNEHSNRYCLNDEVIDSLCVSTASTSTSQDLCPRLNYVKLWGCMNTTDGAIADFVESRWLTVCGEGKLLNMALIKFLNDARHSVDIERFKYLNEKRRGITWIRNRE